MTWVFAITLVLIVLAAILFRKKWEQWAGQTTATKRTSPWWMYGLQFVFFCLLFGDLFVQTRTGTVDYSRYLIPGICLGLMLFQFIREFFKQHAQFSIKSLLILTFCVAVFCSIYSCFGYQVLIWVLIGSYLIITIRFGRATVTKVAGGVDDGKTDFGKSEP